MIWDAELSSTLATLWGEGISTMAIAKKLGITKNSVVGRVHRLKLEGRPSPLHPPRSEPRQVIARAPKDTLSTDRMEAARRACIKTTEAEEIRIRVMSGNGMGNRSIAEKMEVSVDVVKRVLGKLAYQRPLAYRLAAKPLPVSLVPQPVQRALTLTPGRICEWLEGDDKPYVRCTAQATKGSWCGHHHAICFVQGGGA